MNNASKDIAQHLVSLITSNNTPLAIGTNVFVGREPTSPDNCVTIIDRPSWPLDLHLDGTGNYEHTSIQIRVRDRSYDMAGNVQQQIIKLLHGANNFTINGTDYFVCACVSGPFLLEWDENHRAVLISTFDIQRRR